ncbi:MAG: elongation factor Ts [Flavobacteriaceae bacterium]|nr:elongation factor Ts [Flavobacteriaceae bacterium]
MKITASEVNKLRKLTGAGMMDCKKALVEADGNFEKAIENLRKKGQKVAANRADRVSSEGVTLAKVNENNTRGILISINCETDFVAKNESYLKLANSLANLAINHNTLDSFLNSDFENFTVSDKLTEQTGVIGEKIEIGGFKILEAPFVGSYIHAGNKIATLSGLSLSIGDSPEIAKNVAMQAAAMNPIALDEKGVDSTLVEKEIEIAKDQLRQEGKPEEMLDKIASGKIKRFFKDNTLVNQSYIKDGKISVADYVSSKSKDLIITGFCRLSLV